jgi:hypothetical protein
VDRRIKALLTECKTIDRNFFARRPEVKIFFSTEFQNHKSCLTLRPPGVERVSKSKNEIYFLSEAKRLNAIHGM